MVLAALVLSGAGALLLARRAFVPYATAQEEDEDERAERLAVERRFEEACSVCHATDIPLSQRLPADLWKKEVEKMRHWGARLKDGEEEKLVGFLVKRCGPGVPKTPSLESTGVLAESSVAADTSAARGDAARGAGLWKKNCASCHAAQASGEIGVNLRSRPVLYRKEFRSVVRAGRREMPAFSTDTLADPELADVLAWLREQRDEDQEPLR